MIFIVRESNICVNSEVREAAQRIIHIVTDIAVTDIAVTDIAVTDITVTKISRIFAYSRTSSYILPRKIALFRHLVV